MNLRFEAYDSVETLDRNTWNGLAKNAYPMMEWEYYHCLEKSGSVNEQRGYRPRHLVAYLEDRPVVIAPLFERDRAGVEFGDGGLLEFLTELTNVPFNRGLVGSIPYTPVPGYRFLIDSDIDARPLLAQTIDYIDFMCEKSDLGTSRVYFVAPEMGLLKRLFDRRDYIGLQSEYFLWFNNDYADFEDYLRTFKSARRTKIRRERRDIAGMGIQVRMVSGMEAPGYYYPLMHELYRRTWGKYMGDSLRPFLTSEFFECLGREFRHRTVFSVAERRGEILAMAIFYQKNGLLFGRYWGCFEEVPFLHFATCYYAPIEYSILHSIRAMDPGFGGEHKLKRGYTPVPVHHYIKFHGRRRRMLAHSILQQLQFRSETG